MINTIRKHRLSILSLSGFAKLFFIGICTLGFPLAVRAQPEAVFEGFLILVFVSASIGSAFVLWLIYLAFGGKVASAVLVLELATIVVWASYVFSSANATHLQYAEERKQSEGAKSNLLKEAEADCSRYGAEKIFTPATGNEHVFVKIQGAILLPESQHNLRLERSRFSPDFSFEEGIAGGSRVDAVLLEVNYGRNHVAGLLSNEALGSTTIDIEIRRISDGLLLASRSDVELPRGFCLGPDPLKGMIQFMEKALKRANVYRFDRGSTENLK